MKRKRTKLAYPNTPGGFLDEKREVLDAVLKSGDQIRRRIVGLDVNNWPWWLGNDQFHSAHRAALLFKDPIFYSKYDWTEDPELNYFWPE